MKLEKKSKKKRKRKTKKILDFYTAKKKKLKIFERWNPTIMKKK